MSSLLHTINQFESKIGERLRANMDGARQLQHQLNTEIIIQLKEIRDRMKKINSKQRKQFILRMKDHEESVKFFPKLQYREIRHQGSAYEGLLVGGQDPQPEFDVAVIISMGLGKSIPHPHKQYDRHLVFDGEMEAFNNKKQDLLNVFQSNLRSSLCIINKSRKFPMNCFRLQNSKESPAFQINVYEGITREGNQISGGKLWYTFDIVPTLELNTRFGEPAEYYFARQSETDELWRIDTAKEERDALASIDGPGECRKKAIRILKAVRDHQPELSKIPSFVFKTLLLTENVKPGLDWCDAALADRVKGLLVLLFESLETGKLTEVYEPNLNVMDKIKEPYRTHLKNRINNLKKEQCLNNVVTNIMLRM